MRYLPQLMNRLLTCAALGLFVIGLTAQAKTSEALPTDSTETKGPSHPVLPVTGDSLSLPCYRVSGQGPPAAP